MGGVLVILGAIVSGPLTVDAFLRRRGGDTQVLRSQGRLCEIGGQSVALAGWGWCLLPRVCNGSVIFSA